MKENIFTHKLLPVLSILILISFCFINTNVFAANVEFTLKQEHLDNAYDIAGVRNFFIATNPSHVWLFVCEEENATFIVLNNIIKPTSGGVVFYNLQNPSSLEFTYATSNSSAGDSLAYTYYFSSADILNSDGTVFFQKAPLTLAGILEQNNPVEIFQIMMKKLVVSLLVCLIGFLSLRKGWTFLKTVLHKA